MPEPSREKVKKTDTVARTLLVAFSVSLACSSLVASAAVLLQPRQIANEILDVRRNILAVAGLLVPEGDVNELYQSVEPRVVELATGDYARDIDPESFDPNEAAKDPELGVEVPAELDVARVGRRAQWALVYLVRDEGKVSRIILPISGYGLWSTMYGFVAIEPDGNTIADITFYEHGETPGLGDFIAKPAWRGLWRDKHVFDESGVMRLQVVKGRVSPDDPLAEYHVDGVSGATLTGNGVTRMMQYWLGDHGYGPYLRKLQEEGEGS